jgi:hypothetical protein
VSTILNAVGGGFAGGALTWGLTWLREHRRTTDAYRAPQREAIAGIVAAGYDLQLAVQATCEAFEIAADWEESKIPQQIANLHIDNLGDRPQRALLNIGTAFNVGRITVADAECYEAMGKAFNNFAQLQEELKGVGKVEPIAANLRPRITSMRTYTTDLNKDIFALVRAAQKHLAPVQTWRNKRKRTEVRKRLEATYFTYPAEFS